MSKAERSVLLREVADVVRDLPAFLTAPLYRRWHLQWGATQAEVSASMAGDRRLPRAQFRATRAITIDTVPEAVWPWLVQVGCQRAGWYSNDLLDNLGHPSATTILPDLQQCEVTDDHGTRLVTRIHAVYDWRHPVSALLGVVLMEFGDFAMMRRMLRGIKMRAESVAPLVSR